jgi:hypothetical protein
MAITQSIKLIGFIAFTSSFRSSKDGSDNLFSYLKFEFVRWLEKTEISGNMLLKD